MLRRSLIVWSAFVFLAACGDSSKATAPTKPDRTTASELPPPSYPVNGAGESFGSSLDARTPDEEPDLIKAISDEGKVGYVRKSDLDGAPPASPEEAVRYMESPAATQDRTIPVYESDGRTVLGSFTVAASSGEALGPKYKDLPNGHGH